MPPQSSLYFAYGNDLSLSQMSVRAPSAIPISLAILHHYRWVISRRGLANIMPSKDHVVYGILYSLPTLQVPDLDEASGVAIGLYTPIEIDVVLVYNNLDGLEMQVPVPCFAYIDPEAGVGVPSPEYCDRMNQALRDAKLPKPWVAQNIRIFVPRPTRSLSPVYEPPLTPQTDDKKPDVKFSVTGSPKMTPLPDNVDPTVPLKSIVLGRARGSPPQSLLTPTSSAPPSLRSARSSPVSRGILYFTYGTNMWSAQMTLRCPSARRIGVGLLRSYRWGISFSGSANVYPSPSDVVYGSVYAITSQDEEELDVYEDVMGGGHEKMVLDVELTMEGTGSRSVRCLAYVDPRRKEGRPSKEFMHRLNSGLEDAKLPASWVRATIRPIIPET